jgi:hypothetical protein
MGCCNRGNQPTFGVRAGFAPTPASPPRAAAASRRYTQLFYEYTGMTGMTVIGGVTGRRYRFDRPGARVGVEPVDNLSIAAVPGLRRVFSP